MKNFPKNSTLKIKSEAAKEALAFPVLNEYESLFFMIERITNRQPYSLGVCHKTYLSLHNVPSLLFQNLFRLVFLNAKDHLRLRILKTEYFPTTKSKATQEERQHCRESERMEVVNSSENISKLMAGSVIQNVGRNYPHSFFLIKDAPLSQSKGMHHINSVGTKAQTPNKFRAAPYYIFAIVVFCYFRSLW